MTAEIFYNLFILWEQCNFWLALGPQNFFTHKTHGTQNLGTQNLKKRPTYSDKNWGEGADRPELGIWSIENQIDYKKVMLLHNIPQKEKKNTKINNRRSNN